METCADSIREVCPLFQAEGGGSIPTSALEENRFIIQPVDYKKIAGLLRAFHYKGDKIGGGISHCLGLMNGATIIGGSVLGVPRHESVYNNGGDIVVFEIRRMVCREDAPKNTESYFLSKIIWWVKKYTKCDRLISYADRSVGHNGTIYKAANFRCVGETGATRHVYWRGKRYHPRSLTIDRPYSHELRKAVAMGDAEVTTEKPKTVWIYDVRPS